MGIFVCRYRKEFLYPEWYTPWMDILQRTRKLAEKTEPKPIWKTCSAERPSYHGKLYYCCVVVGEGFGRKV